MRYRNFVEAYQTGYWHYEFESESLFELVFDVFGILKLKSGWVKDGPLPVHHRKAQGLSITSLPRSKPKAQASPLVMQIRPSWHCSMVLRLLDSI